MKESIIKEEVPFSMIANELLNDKDITAKAKGIYAFMFSKKENWNFTIRSMSKQLKEGSRSISGALLELKEKGWVSYYKKNNGSGVYTIHVKPKLQNSILDNNQNCETATCENANLTKCNHISNIDLYSNTDEVNNTEVLFEVPLIDKKNKKEKIEKEKIIFPFDSKNFIEQWNIWKEYKSVEHKFKFKSFRSEQSSLKNLNELSKGIEENAIKIMHQSMANGWKGFFELKTNQDEKRNALNQIGIAATNWNSSKNGNNS